MKKTIFILLLAGIAGLALAKQKPNILFIAVDDLKPMLGCYGDPDVLTPNIDKLAKRGTVFLNNACQQTICAPSRASLMTGTYPDTTKVFDLKTQMRKANAETLTLPEYLRKHGYETTGTGKIYDPRSVDKKFDAASWSIPFQQYPPWDYVPEGSPKPYKGFHTPEIKKDAKKFAAYVKKHGLVNKQSKAYAEALLKFPMAKPAVECMDVPDAAYQDGMFALYAVDQMEELAAARKKGGKPFFLGVGFAKPHLPFVAPKKYWDLYDRSEIKLAPFQQRPEGAPEFAYQDSQELRNGYTGIPKGPIPAAMQLEMIHGYRACVSYIDAQVGKVLDKLEALGLADDTIVVFWGDHGFHLGDHGMFCKHTNYEQAVRAPLIIAAPGQKAKGTASESPSEFIDIFPTLCDLLDLPIPERLEGLSLVPVLENPIAGVREAALEQYPRDKKMGYSLRDKRYRYIKWIDVKYYAGDRAGPMVAVELYDLEKDPDETINQAANPEYGKVVARFEQIFKQRGVAQAK